MGLLSYFKQRQNGRKPYEHRANFIPAWKRLPDCIGAEYESGETLIALSIKYHTTNGVIRQKLESLGVKIRPKGYHGPNNNHPRKLDADKIAWILEQDSQDVPHAEIARQIGNVTRERIRQICLANGCATRRSRQTKALSIKEMREANKAEYQKMVLAASEAWKNGASLLEMSALLGGPDIKPNINHGSSRVSWLRKKHPDLFPHRKPNHWKIRGLSKAERAAQAKALSRAWTDNMHINEIAKQFGYKTAQSAAQAIHYYRFHFPDLFPNRNPVKGGNGLKRDPSRMLRVSQAWKDGRHYYAIARDEGYIAPKSLYNAIISWRKAHPDLFPKRRLVRMKASSVQDGNDNQ